MFGIHPSMWLGLILFGCVALGMHSDNEVNKAKAAQEPSGSCTIMFQNGNSLDTRYMHWHPEINELSLSYNDMDLIWFHNDRTPVRCVVTTGAYRGAVFFPRTMFDGAQRSASVQPGETWSETFEPNSPWIQHGLYFIQYTTEY